MNKELKNSGHQSAPVNENDDALKVLHSQEMQLPEEMEFNLSDFALFLSVMKNKEAYESVLSIVMEEPDLKLTEVHVEEVILNRIGKRAIRLDVWAVDVQDRHYATEMQNDTQKDDVRRRARFYQGLLDTPLLKSGRKTRYKNLPSTIVTFITQEDIFKRDLTKYTFTERCEEISDLLLEDGTTKIFLNMTSKNGDPVLVSLLQYMKKTQLNNPEVLVLDDRIRKLDKIVAEVKQSEEWEAVKMSILSIGLERGKEQGIEQGMKAVIKMCKEFKLTRAGAKERLISEFSITDEDAEAALSKFWQD